MMMKLLLPGRSASELVATTVWSRRGRKNICKDWRKTAQFFHLPAWWRFRRFTLPTPTFQRGGIIMGREPYMQLSLGIVYFFYNFILIGYFLYSVKHSAKKILNIFFVIFDLFHMSVEKKNTHFCTNFWKLKIDQLYPLRFFHFFDKCVLVDKKCQLLSYPDF